MAHERTGKPGQARPAGGFGRIGGQAGAAAGTGAR